MRERRHDRRSAGTHLSVFTCYEIEQPELAFPAVIGHRFELLDHVQLVRVSQGIEYANRRKTTGYDAMCFGKCRFDDRQIVG